METQLVTGLPFTSPWQNRGFRLTLTAGHLPLEASGHPPWVMCQGRIAVTMSTQSTADTCPRRLLGVSIRHQWFQSDRGRLAGGCLMEVGPETAGRRAHRSSKRSRGETHGGT